MRASRGARSAPPRPVLKPIAHNRPFRWRSCLRPPAKACKGVRPPQSCSLRSAAVTTGDKHREPHPREWGRRRDDTRCAHTALGAARLLGTNYRCGMQSRCNRASLMHQPRLPPTFVCHPVAWRNSCGQSTVTRRSHKRHIGTPCACVRMRQQIVATDD
jgi:hypothetical protein